MSGTIKVVIAVIVLLGAGGVGLYVLREHTADGVPPVPLSPPGAGEVRKGPGDIDQLPPVALPGTQAPAQQASGPKP